MEGDKDVRKSKGRYPQSVPCSPLMTRVLHADSSTPHIYYLTFAHWLEHANSDRDAQELQFKQALSLTLGILLDLRAVLNMLNYLWYLSVQENLVGITWLMSISTAKHICNSDKLEFLTCKKRLSSELCIFGVFILYTNLQSFLTGGLVHGSVPVRCFGHFDGSWGNARGRRQGGRILFNPELYQARQF